MTDCGVSRFRVHFQIIVRMLLDIPDTVGPFPVLLLRRHPEERLQDTFHIAHEAGGDADVFSDFGRVNVNLEDLAVPHEFNLVAGGPVGKAGADGDQQIAFIQRLRRTVPAVHADHAEETGVGVRDGGEAHDRQADGCVDPVGKRLKLRGGI